MAVNPKTKETRLDAASGSAGPGVVFAALGISAHREDLARLREIFNRMGWKLREARSWREASSVLSAHWLPVVLCDRSLPDGDWKDVVSLTAPLLDSPRVIVMSESSSSSWTAEVTEMGAYAVLAKPIKEDDVIQVMTASCQSSARAGIAAATRPGRFRRVTSPPNESGGF